MAKQLSTYERLMQNDEFKKEYQKEYKKFLFNELLCALMDNDHKSVRVLAEQCDVSPKIIQNLKTGKQKDLKLSTFFKVIEVFGYEAFIEKGEEKIPLSGVIEEANPPPHMARVTCSRKVAVAKHRSVTRRKEP